MVFLDTRWKPLRGGTVGFIDDAAVIPDGHVYPKGSDIPFPGESHRFTYDLRVSDAWAAAIGLSDFAAFTSLGPCGDGRGNNEPAQLWQDTLDRLRLMDTEALRVALDEHVSDGRLSIDLDTGINTRAHTLGAYLDATAYADLMAGRDVGQCATCGRHMVKLKPKQTFCSTRCRMQNMRKKQKDAG